MRYAKIWMKGRWWSWNEDRKRLVDGSRIEWENKGMIGFGEGKKVEGGEVKEMGTGKWKRGAGGKGKMGMLQSL